MITFRLAVCMTSKTVERLTVLLDMGSVVLYSPANFTCEVGRAK